MGNANDIFFLKSSDKLKREQKKTRNKIIKLKIIEKHSGIRKINRIFYYYFAE